MTWHQKPFVGTPLDWGNPLNKGCVLHLAGNEGMGDRVQDLSMYGNHGTLKNFAFPSTVASGWNLGPTGQVLTTDGVNDYIDCGNKPSLDITEEITISLFLKIHSFTINEYNIYIGRKSSNITAGCGLSWGLGSNYGTGNKIRFMNHFVGSDDCTNPFSSVSTLSLNKWYYIVGSYDSNTGRQKIYINGTLDNTKNVVGAPNFVAPEDGLRIGRSPYYWGKHSNCSIDQVRIQNRAWTAKEVRDYAINPWAVYLDDED